MTEFEYDLILLTWLDKAMSAQMTAPVMTTGKQQVVTMADFDTDTIGEKWQQMITVERDRIRKTPKMIDYQPTHDAFVKMLLEVQP